MSDLNQMSKLAIIGIESFGPNFSNIDSYGSMIYQGKTNEKFEFNLTKKAGLLQESMSRLFQQARVEPGESEIIFLNEALMNEIESDSIHFLSNPFSSRLSGLNEAFNAAIDILDGGEAECVLLLDEHALTSTISMALICLPKYARENSKTVLGWVDGFSDQSINSTFAEKLTESFKQLDHTPEEIGLLITSDKDAQTPEITGKPDLLSTFSSSVRKSCALASGYGGLLSLVKAAWCVYNRVIPATFDWQSPEDSKKWEDAGFYIPTESRTWFTSSEQPSRIAVVVENQKNNDDFILLITEENDLKIRTNSAISHSDIFMFPVSGDSIPDLISNLEHLQNSLDSQSNLKLLSRDLLENVSPKLHTNDFIVTIIGHNWEEVTREIGFALKSLPAAVEKNVDWRTPAGSYFTPNPLGKTGSVCFVYPGAFNSYPGVARDLFYLFPALYERMSGISKNLSALLNEKMLYPRSAARMTSADLEQAEKNLSEDPLAMLISGTSLAALYTFLLRGTFDIHPISAVGYSLGEISMMFASGVWTKADETSAALRVSPLFRTRLAGAQNAVRESWNMTIQETANSDELLWANYVLMATPESVRSVIQSVERVYLTHINTPRQVVIAGDPDSCRLVIDRLKCNALQAPFNYALHCDAMASEYDDLKTLHTWPVTNQPGMTLYSAATYQAMPIDSQKIAEQIANCLTHQLDFPRLVNQSYNDGARIFIELGAGSNCSRWVDESLKEFPHASFSINRKGVDDYSAITQLLAKLISHHVQVNLSAILT